MDGRESLYIIDASVLFKWAVAETEYLAEALTFREDFIEKRVRVMVPVHCFSEVCNALSRKHHPGTLSFFATLITSEIMECRLTLELVHDTLRLMKECSGTTFYDANYHALAIRERGIFLTADERYYRKTRRKGHIMLLKDYGKKRYAAR